MSNYTPQPLLLHAITEPAPAVPPVLCTTDPISAANENTGCTGEDQSLLHDTSTEVSETVRSTSSGDSESFVYALEVLRQAISRFPGGCIPVNPLPPNLCELPPGFQPLHPESFTEEEKERRNGPTIFIPPFYIKRKEPTHSFHGATWIIYLTDEGLSAVANITVRRSGRLLLEINNVLGKPVTCPTYYFTRLRLLHLGMAYVEAFAYVVNDLVVPQTSQGWPPIVLCLHSCHVAMPYSKDMVVWEKRGHLTKERDIGPILRLFSRLFARINPRDEFYATPFYGA